MAKVVVTPSLPLSAPPIPPGAQGAPGAPAVVVPSEATIYIGGVFPGDDAASDLRTWFEGRGHGPIREIVVKNLEGGRADDVDAHADADADADANRDGVAAKRKKRKKKPFAFLTFADADAAERALRDANVVAASSTGDGDGEVAVLPPFVNAAQPQALAPLPPRAMERRMRNYAKRAEEEARLHDLDRRFADAAYSDSKKCPIVLALRCPSSHASRMGRYLREEGRYAHMIAVGCASAMVTSGAAATTAPDSEGSEQPWITTSFRRPGNVSLLFFSAPSASVAQELFAALGDDPNLGAAMHKIHALGSPRLVRASREGGNVSVLAGAVAGAVREVSSGEMEVSLRLEAFPPKLVDNLKACLEEFLPEVELSPTNFTYVASVLEVADKVYAVGVSSRAEFPTRFRPTAHRGNGSSSASASDPATCRAHHKLLESLRRRTSFPSLPPDSFSGKVAIDCGAAPGGWTECLLRHGALTVYSIDPAALDPAVEGMSGTVHVRERAESALPRLAAEGVRADVWVSDMCLHDVEDQVRFLLRTRELGAAGAGTMFVLTLKCTRGHSDATYDLQAEKIVWDLLLKGGEARDVKIMHLFTNRGGERTVTGFLT